MNRLFGQSKSKTVPQPTLNDTAAVLDSKTETINKQISAIDQELQAYNKLPAARKASQKSRAMALLNKKKMYERQRATIEGQATNIGATAFALENTKTQQQIYQGLREAKGQLAQGNKTLNPDKVHDLMDDLDDHIHDQDEMNDMFSRPIGQDAYTTDADLESELAGLAEAEFDMYNDLSAPSVPVQPVVSPYASGTTTINNMPVDEYGLPKRATTGMRN